MYSTCQHGQYSLYSSRSHPVYNSFLNHPQTKHSHISFFPSHCLPPPLYYSQSSHIKHFLLSHCFLLWDLPTQVISPLTPSGALLRHRNCFLLKVYKTATNLLTGTTGTHQRHSSRSSACFQENSWIIGHMSLLTHRISMTQVRWMSTSTAQG